MARVDENGSTSTWNGVVRGALAAGARASTLVPFTEAAHIELVVDIEGIRALTPNYERLYQATGNTLPYATQEWHLAWCEHLPPKHTSH